VINPLAPCPAKSAAAEYRRQPAILILMVVRQIREHPLDLRSLAVPVLAVGCAAVLFLHSVPGGGNDVALELACVLAGPAPAKAGVLAGIGA
jgi:hypothetical protein